MYLSEQHIVSKVHKSWKSIDNTCFLSKNLYNYTLYKIKEHYEDEKTKGKFLRANDIMKLFAKENQTDFRALPSTTSQQIINAIDQAHRNFFKSIKKYSKSKQGYKAPPRPPKYKHKTKGRNIIIFMPKQVRINKKDGLIHFPKITGIPHLKTKASSFKQIRIIPKKSCYIIEVIYDKEINDLNLNKQNVASIDLGTNNLCALTTNQPDKIKSFLINGRPVKSINQYYNKLIASAQSKLMKQNEKRFASHKTRRITLKRNNKINNYFHHASKYIINYCIKNDIGKIIIGKNDGWKQDINIGRKNNQMFTDIPHNKLIWQLRYKGELAGIEVIEINEAYTSKCSALDLEPIEKQETYLGKRIKRGLFRTSDKTLINADINGSLNILRKAIGDEFLLESKSNRGYVVYPVSVVPTQI